MGLSKRRKPKHQVYLKEGRLFCSIQSNRLLQSTDFQEHKDTENIRTPENPSNSMRLQGTTSIHIIDPSTSSHKPIKTGHLVDGCRLPRSLHQEDAFEYVIP